MGKLIYGTMTGTTEIIADRIKEALPDLINESKCVQRANASDFQDSDFLVLGGSTWGDGELTDDWADFLPQLSRIDLSGKTVALFALGDQVSYTYNFVSAMKILYDQVIARGAQVIVADIPTDGFDFEHSESIVDGKFVGLVVDEVNEPDLTNERIASWSKRVRAAMLQTA